jgi:hypothetical protein
MHNRHYILLHFHHTIHYWNNTYDPGI